VLGRRTRAEPHRLKPGDYSWSELHGWCACCPNSEHLVANLNGHKVTELADGRIAVSPSIECSGHHNKQRARELNLYFHGWLENGVWLDERRLPWTPAVKLSKS
jgi:hypothetical protein